MALSAVDIKAIVKERGWSFVDLAARWGVSVTWMSRLVNSPHTRPAMYDDAFRGLPTRNAVTVAREARHIRKRKPAERRWTAAEMFPIGRIFEALDNRWLEEGTRLYVRGLTRTASGQPIIQFEIATGDAEGDQMELPMELAQVHLADIGLDQP